MLGWAVLFELRVLYLRVQTSYSLRAWTSHSKIHRHHLCKTGIIVTTCISCTDLYIHLQHHSDTPKSDPLESHFIVKLGFKMVYIIFQASYFAQTWIAVLTTRVLSIYVLSKNKTKNHKFSSQNCQFYKRKNRRISCYVHPITLLTQHCFI